MLYTGRKIKEYLEYNQIFYAKSHFFQPKYHRYSVFISISLRIKSYINTKEQLDMIICIIKYC